MKLWAPFLVYTAEEVWTHFSHLGHESVHYEEFPSIQTYEKEEELREDINRLLNIRSLVTKAIEEARHDKIVASSQEAKVILTLSKKDKDLLVKNLESSVAQWLIVSQVELCEGEQKVEVMKAGGHKCPRCWNYDENVDGDGLCPRCHRVMEGFKKIK